MSDPESPAEDVFDVDRIRRLVELMEEHDLREVDLRQSEQRIRLCRGAEQVMAAPYAAPVAPPLTTATPAASGPMASPPAEPGRPAPEPVDDNLTVIKSPMVGTFYARPNPNADAYVQVGDLVEPETTICIIEAMKVFNEIPAEVRGKVVEILVDDEEPVDHGRPLFKIDTQVD